ncbi:MAG: restriction endonuclease [Proteobacteria bacterium]|nr:restriction endonuclease [Pseudomonadota bacterium]
MAIPDYQTLMLPILKSVGSRSVSDAKAVIADMVKEFKLTEDEVAQLLPSKTQTVINNRVYWALVYLVKAGLVSRPDRGKYVVTDEGKKVLSNSPSKIDVKFLNQFESFQDFKALKGTRSQAKAVVEEQDLEKDPLEALEASYDRLAGATEDEVLAQVRSISPSEFEILVVELLKNMGYGAAGLESVVRTGKSGDGGIDGEISQDPLGLDMIYIQAKKYQEGSGVGRPALQQFVGSLNERKASKGIFITTSHFSQDAKDYINKIDIRVILIDGERLAELMYEYGVGVQEEKIFRVKKIDLDFFENLES